jgi:hypothetical protein
MVFVIRHSPFLFWLTSALLLGLFYLAVAAWGFGGSGFPLDDAWIHQTYARNLARSGQLAFIPGVPSAGSTAPLWSFLLSLGYVLGLPFQIWAYGLGIICLGLTGWTINRLGQQLFPQQPQVAFWAAFFCLGEWHLIWAAVSGMETMLFVWLSLFLVERYRHFSTRGSAFINLTTAAGLTLGLLGGLLTLTRPEGLGLFGLIGLDLARRSWAEPAPEVTAAPGSKQTKRLALLQQWFWLAIGLQLLLMPYIAFHLWHTGQPFPNTFYAKQAEYRIILEQFPLWQRLFGAFDQNPETAQGVFRVIFIGAQFLLLPGLAYAAWLTFSERRTNLWLIWLWWLGYLLLYGLRLPVTYQHGRYQIPAIAWMIVLAVWGLSRLLNKLPRRSMPLRAVRQALLFSLGLLVVGFIVLGARAYGADVRFIQTEMVATAHWLADNTPPTALIAAHDIGAIGYFAQRPLIDLAGLITPELIPILRNEPALYDFIVRRQAAYLVTFPSWYDYLIHQPRFTPVYSTHSASTRTAGSDNMVVYQIRP